MDHTLQSEEKSVGIKGERINLPECQGQKVPKQILFVRNMAETIRVYVGLVVGCVLNMARQAIESEIVLSQVLKVSIVILQLSQVTQINKVPLSVPPVGSTQTNSMHSSPNKIRKVILMWSLVHYGSSIYKFMPY